MLPRRFPSEYRRSTENAFRIVGVRHGSSGVLSRVGSVSNGVVRGPAENSFAAAGNDSAVEGKAELINDVLIDGPELQPTKGRITANGRETKTYHPHGNVKADQRRGLMLAVLFQAATDYHDARQVKENHRIRTEAMMGRLTQRQRDVIYAGKAAFEWFTGPPTPRGSGFTYQQICDHFGVSSKRLWQKLRRYPDVRVRLGNLRTGAAGTGPKQ